MRAKLLIIVIALLFPKLGFPAPIQIGPYHFEIGDDREKSLAKITPPYKAFDFEKLDAFGIVHNGSIIGVLSFSDNKLISANRDWYTTTDDNEAITLFNALFNALSTAQDIESKLIYRLGDSGQFLINKDIQPQVTREQITFKFSDREITLNKTKMNGSIDLLQVDVTEKIPNH